jgi:predicted Zn-dependent protease
MKTLTKLTTILIGLVLLTNGCDKDRGFIIMPLSQEIALGEQLDSTIRAPENQDEYPVLPRETNLQAYQYLEGMMQEILNNDAEPLKYKDKFEWKITIINKDVMNAFAAPGGKLYFYTGLMKYLNNASSLAGVLGHEMSHADLRHSARQMQKYYGMNFAANILFGTDKTQLEQILTDVGSGLAQLQFSRDDEYQADEFSIKYLAGTRYNPKGIAGFFEQLNSDGKTNDTWEVLSTHPSDDHRLNNINDVWTSVGSPTGGSYEEEYSTFKALLP